MKELKEVVMDIHEELECAEKYAKEAVKHKEQYPALASVYYRISTDDLAHMDMLHKQAVDMIEISTHASLAGRDGIRQQLE